MTLQLIIRIVATVGFIIYSALWNEYLLERYFYAAAYHERRAKVLLYITSIIILTAIWWR